VENQDETELKVLAIEAKRRLGLNYEDRRNSQETRRLDAMTAELKNFDNYAERVRQQIIELNFQRRELAETFGPGHSRIRSIDERIKYLQSELESTLKQRADLALSMETLGDESKEQSLDWDAVQAKTDQQWIKLYLVSLERDQNRLITSLNSIADELTSAQAEASKVSGDVAEVRLLERQIQDKRDSLRVILDRLSEINLLSQNYNNIRVRVLDPPNFGLQINPVLIKSIGVGTILLSLLGVGLALLVDRADLSFHNPTEIFTSVEIPVVGRIPRMQLSEGKDGKTLGSSSLVAANQPNSVGAEAFRTIRTNLFFDAATNGTKVIMLTSPSPGDGKSTAACNLAISIAQTGKRVVLIDADLRRPRVHVHFGIQSKEGVMSVLKGETTLKDALQETFLPNLFILPCGQRPKNPGEVVTSPNFAKMIEMLRESFDFVILDTPPVLPVSDPTAISTLVDGVYLVFRIRRGVKITASRAKECLSQVNARLMGVIVNGLDENPHYNDYGGYYQYSGYGKAYQDRMAESYKSYIE
jgi:succinoglycan biosynthesis transport protein ExoP